MTNSDQILQGITKLGKQIGGLDKRMGKLEDGQRGLETRIGGLEEGVRRLEVLHEATDEKFDQILEAISPEFEKTTDLQIKTDEHGEALENHELRIGHIEQKAT